jgi:hypothetical protein
VHELRRPPRKSREKKVFIVDSLKKSEGIMAYLLMNRCLVEALPIVEVIEIDRIQDGSGVGDAY